MQPVRRVDASSLSDVALDGVEKLSLAGLADWAANNAQEKAQ